MGGTGSGRARKPREFAAIAGTLRPDRDRKPMEVGRGKPRKPSDLDPVASQFWDETIVRLIKSKAVTAVDAPQARLLAELWSLTRKTMKAASRKPLDRDVRIALLGFQKAFDHLAARFGLSPSDRARIGSLDQPKGKGIKRRPRPTGRASLYQGA